jgi:hypothetical protein
MHAGGSHWGFYVDAVPDWIPHRDGAKAWREYHLAVEDGDLVRGGYALKPQQWWVRGEVHMVADWQGPFSEGAVNARYSTLGLRMLRDMLKRYPFLYSLGHGSDEEPIVQLLKTLGWTLHNTPFCFRIIRPYRFLRLNRYLRKEPKKALALDLLAYSGLGTIGLPLVHAALRLRAPQRFASVARVVPEFGAWADTIWQDVRNQYECTAVRDRSMMNSLVPQGTWPFGTILRVDRGGSTLGWAVVVHKKMRRDPRFGALHVGCIADCLSATEHTGEVIHAAHEYLAGQGADLVYANQAHPAWVRGCEANGYVVLPNRRLFAISPKLDNLLGAEALQYGLHLTNMDGHGPHGFEPEGYVIRKDDLNGS